MVVHHPLQAAEAEEVVDHPLYGEEEEAQAVGVGERSRTVMGVEEERWMREEEAAPVPWS